MPTLLKARTNEEIMPKLPWLDAGDLLVPGGGQVEEPEDCLVEVAALDDQEQEESEDDRETAVPEEEVEGVEVPAVVLAVDAPAATDAHEVTEEEDKEDKVGPFGRREFVGLALKCEADRGQGLDGRPGSGLYLREPEDMLVQAAGTDH